MKNDKENAILLSAYEQFKKKGYSKATVSDIAKGASVGKGTIYEYFESKYDLFYKMIEHLIDKSQQTITDAIDQEEYPIDKLKAFYKVSKNQAHLAYTTDLSFDRENTKKMLNKVMLILVKNRESRLETLKEIFRDCKEQNIIKDVDIGYVATFFFSICAKSAQDNLLYAYSDLNPSKEIVDDGFIEVFLEMINN